MEPQIRFCTSADGTRIAHATVGEGPPLVRVPGWGHSLERIWEHPDSRGFMQGLAEGRSFVSFDQRGLAASQREVDDLALAAQVADVAAVVDHLQLERVDLWGTNEAAAVAVVYAAQHPERVSRLVLWSPHARLGDVSNPQTAHALVELVRGNWSLARRTLSDILFPSGPIELQRWYSNSLRESAAPEVAVKYLETGASLDITPFLPQVKAPTLVLHRRRSRVVPASAARAVAALIPEARFLLLDGDIGHPFFGDVSYIDTVTEFLDEGRAREPAVERPDAGAVHTILFTDVEGSTALTERLGDAGARELLREHERITREALKAHGGSEVKTMGDGFMTSFGSATKALECAIAIQRAFAQHNDSADEPIKVRIGLNAGEPISEDEDLFGTAINMAARICAKADGAQILAPIVVRELVAGKGFLLSDVGDTELRGFEDPVRLFEVRWRE